jgi:acetyl-CoA acetyltransferase
MDPTFIPTQDLGFVEINEALAFDVIASVAGSGLIPRSQTPTVLRSRCLAEIGARVATTLLTARRSRGGRSGLETMCFGAGQGMAMTRELLA